MTDRPATITTVQLQHLHALLRDHGMTSDTVTRTWIDVWLTEHEAEPVESRADVPTLLAAKMIHDLSTTDVVETAAPNRRGLNRLRATFEPEAIGKLPRSTCRDCSRAPNKRCDRHTWVSGCLICNGSHSNAAMHIDYVGHADVTARLLEVDPTWTWEPMALDQASGMPLLDRTGGLWIRLTVLGVTRPGYGDVTGTGGVKEAIGDALRNAAMRFGVALDLWAKGDREWSRIEKTDATTVHPDQAQPSESTPPEYRGKLTPALLDQLAADAVAVGITMEAITAKLRQDLRSDMDVDGEFTVAMLAGVDPWVIAPFAQAAHEHAAKVVAGRAAADAAAAEQAATETATAATEDVPEKAFDTPETTPAAGADPWATPGESGEQPPA